MIQKSSTSAALILLHHSRHMQALGRSGECCGVRLKPCWQGHAAVVPMHSHTHAMRPLHDRQSWRRRSDTVAWAVCSGAICGGRAHEHGTMLVQAPAASRASESHDTTSSPESLPGHGKSAHSVCGRTVDRSSRMQALRCWLYTYTRAAVMTQPLQQRPHRCRVTSPEVVREPWRPSEAPLRCSGMACVQWADLRWPRT